MRSSEALLLNAPLGYHVVASPQTLATYGLSAGEWLTAELRRPRLGWCGRAGQPPTTRRPRGEVWTFDF